MRIEYNHSKTMEGSAEGIIYEYIPIENILSHYEENITEMRVKACGEWEDKTNREFYEYEKTDIIRTLFDQCSEWEVLEELANTLREHGECVIVLDGPEEYNEEKPFKVFFFKVYPESKSDTMELAITLYKEMEKYNIKHEDVMSEIVQREL